MSETQRIHKVVKQWLEHAEEDLRLAKHAEWVKDLHEAETLTDYAVTARYPGPSICIRGTRGLSQNLRTEGSEVVESGLSPAKRKWPNLPLNSSAGRGISGGTVT